MHPSILGKRGKRGRDVAARTNPSPPLASFTLPHSHENWAEIFSIITPLESDVLNTKHARIFKRSANPAKPVPMTLMAQVKRQI
jgi:hypothetical protein